MAPIDLRVAAARTEATDIRSLRLVAAAAQPLPPFAAGAHLRVQAALADGRQASRAYSLVNAPALRDHYEIGVLRMGRGGVSDALHRLVPGDTLWAEPPRSGLALAPQAGAHLLVAGGIGLTPLLSMASQLTADGAPFRLWVLVGSRDRLPFADHLARLPAGSVRVHASAQAGRLSPATLFDGLAQGAHVYVCGPPSLHVAMRAAATRVGVPAGRLHEERFDGGRTEGDDRSFEVHLRASGLRLTVASGQTILERALQAGVFPAYDCQRGECGTCLTRVLDGEPEHRDTVQTEAEKARHRFIAICCSRARSEQLVLDL